MIIAGPRIATARTNSRRRRTGIFVARQPGSVSDGEHTDGEV